MQRHFLHDLIKPIVAECKFSIKSTKEFKDKILEIESFDQNEYEIVSYDCIQLYTSINIDRVLKFILDKIYLEPSKFFPETTKLVKINKELVNRPVEPPPRHKLQKFFKSVLCDFNSFEALNGFFRQTQGCSMGSKLSPSLANIFCSLFETAIIEPDLENKNLLGYVRYVDDILLIVKRDYKDRLLGKLNAFDPFLKFTTESMVDSKINFLDTTVTLNNRQINLEMYRKPTFTDKTVDFKNSISPKNYKWSTFIGEIFRCNNCTSDINSRDRAIENTKQIF